MPPSFLMIVALGWIYARYGGLSWMQAMFYGVGPSVIGIIALSAWTLTTKNIGRDVLLWRFKQLSVLVIVIAAAAIGLALFTFYPLPHRVQHENGL